MNIEIANRLVQLRKANHLSQEELANQIGISRQAVSKWERAEASPDTDNLILLARLYKISLDELLKTADPVEPAEDTGDRDAARLDTAGERENHGGGNLWIWFPYPVLVAIVYLALGYCFGTWRYGGILFMTIPLYYWAVRAIPHWKRERGQEGNSGEDAKP